MRKILNPYAEIGRIDYQCFGCSPNNPVGLHLEFWENGEEVNAKWMPRRSLQGFRDVLHGGIQATLLDELAAWIVQTQCRTVGVTSSLEIKYHRPIHISDGEIMLRGKIKEKETKLVIIETELLGNDGKVCASAIIKYFLFSPQKAAKEYFYPGADAF